MARQRATVNVTGMNRDMAKSRFDPRFSFENKNIRISARDEQCTSFVITNERGPKMVSSAVVHGTPVGVFECDKYFGIFSFWSGFDYITVYEKDGDKISEYFRWSGKGLDFDEIDTKTQRIETEVSVEASNSIRVYWVDGVHQPRVIDFMKLRKRYGKAVTDEDIDADYFGFLPVVKDISSFKVDKRFSGYYYTGTVQFAVSEVINGNESNLVYYSPLYYASDDANNRGFAPDNQTIGCSFDITFTCADYEKVDYFIVYAIHRATQNGAPICVKREMQAVGTVRCTIAGSEEVVDASHVLFLNRQPMVGAKTIQQKDGVLFVANWHNDEREDVELKFNTYTRPSARKDRGGDMQNATMSESGAAMNSQLKHNSYEIGHFKKGEKYLLGVQFMDKYGYWGEPILVKKYTSDTSGNVVVAKDENGKEITLHEMTYGADIDDKGRIVLPYFSAGIAAQKNFKKVRPVIAYVDDAQKPVLYQGFVTPTIYCEKERVEGSCYAKLSPFTRSFKVFKENQFHPRKLWCNPNYIICEKGKVKLHSDVYLTGRDDQDGDNLYIRTYDGYGMTGLDAGVDQSKASMKYGTYPASQHLQQLGCNKDYNGELQTSWRFREVAYKTALIPKDIKTEFESASLSQDSTTVLSIEINFNISYWGKIYTLKDYIFVGKPNGEGFYKMIYFWGKTRNRVVKKTLSTAVDGSNTLGDMLFDYERSDYNELVRLLVEYVCWEYHPDKGGLSKRWAEEKPYMSYKKYFEDLNYGDKYEYEPPKENEDGSIENAKIPNLFNWNGGGLRFSAINPNGTDVSVDYAEDGPWVNDGQAAFEDRIKNIQSVVDRYFFTFVSFKAARGAVYDTYGSYRLKTVGGASLTSNEDSNGICTQDNSLYFVDAETVTFHSPDVKEETSLAGTEAKVKVVGAASMDGFVSDTSIVAKSGKFSEKALGTFGFQNLRPHSDFSGRCAMNLPNWSSAWDECVKDRAQYWSVPPFGVNDYLAIENNEVKVNNKVTSQLDYHQLANYRFCGRTAYSEGSDFKADFKTAFGTSTPITVLGDQSCIYKSSEDALISPSMTYFWSNGPLYCERKIDEGKKHSLDTYDCNYTETAAGIYNIPKYENKYMGKLWKQLIHACQWLNSEDMNDPLSINLSSFQSVTSSSRKEKNRGYWSNGGTVEKSKGEYSIGGDKIKYMYASYRDDKFLESNMNSLINANTGYKDKICLDSYRLDSDYGNDGNWDEDDDPRTFTVSLKYDSNPHVVMKLDRPLDNYTYLVKHATTQGNWGLGGEWKKDEISDFACGSTWKNGVSVPFLNVTEDDDFLWVVDIVNNDGDISSDPHTAQWMIGGEAVDIEGGTATVNWVQGNWYFQRYDCLRTFPNSITEKNQVVEIVSFMCETRRNLDGRYDSHAGKAFLQANRTNFNLINDAYTQLNNFFSYSMPSVNDNVVHSYPNTVTWSIPKTLNANVDAWTSITGASILDMEGDKGDIVHLTRLANSLFCFQPSGISQIRYNEQTSISTENGTPLELAMNGKVDGKLYVSTSTGACSNVNVCATDSAIYFVDQYNKTMNAIAGEGVKLISEEQGFHSWFATKNTLDRMKLVYDRKNRCVMAVDSQTALVYNEMTGAFESFMSYENTFETVNVQNKTLLLHKHYGMTYDENDEELGPDWKDDFFLYDMNMGEYNIFFGKEEDFWIDTLISGSPSDKIFDNVEFRGDLYSGDEFAPRRCPFNYIRAYNEYQDSGKKVLKFDPTYTSYRSIKQALMLNSNAKNRFRAWHLFVPRNALIKGEYKAMYMADRMRNPWCHIVLGRSQSSQFGGVNKDRAEIQDINVDYTE